MSRETDTEPAGTLDEAALQRGAAVVRKVNEADGPLHLDADEAATLKAILLGFQKQTQIDALIEALTVPMSAVRRRRAMLCVIAVGMMLS